MSPKGSIINVKERNTLIRSCGVTIPINVRQKEQLLTRKLLASQEIVISPYLEAIVSLVLLPLLDNCEFLFHLTTQANLTLFMHIVNHQTSKVLVKNVSNKTLCIPYHHKLGHLIDIIYDN